MCVVKIGKIWIMGYSFFMQKEQKGTLAVLTSKIVKFRNARDWQQFHNPKDMSLSLVLEASELMEHFQWKNDKEMKDHLESHKIAIGDELADILYWVLLMSHDFKIDIKKALEDKLKKNEQKYPIKQAKGNNKKYNELSI